MPWLWFVGVVLREMKRRAIQLYYAEQQSAMVLYSLSLFRSRIIMAIMENLLCFILAGIPESILDWTRDDSDLSNQNSSNQVFSRKHWRLVQCQNGMVNIVTYIFISLTRLSLKLYRVVMFMLWWKK